MFVSYIFIYILILSCFISTIHPQNSNAVTPSAASSSRIGPTPCFLFGDYFSRCEFETTICDQIPSECSSYIWNEVTVDSTYDVYDKTEPSNDLYFRKLLQCTENPITLTYGYESLEEWSLVLASCGSNGSNVLDELEGLSTYLKERQNISGIMLNNLDIISGTLNFTNFTENLNCYIDALKKNLPNMEIGIYLHADNLQTYYEGLTVDWINFNELTDTVNFIMVAFPFANNECTLDWTNGIFPMAVDSDYTLEEFLQVLNTAGVPKAKLHLRFELDPAAEAPSFCENDIQQVMPEFVNY